RYEVGAAGVSVHHLRRKSYPWDEIEAVRVLRRPLRGFVRIGMGSTTAGFHVGPFRESRLGRIQAYVTAVTPPLVVLEPRSDPDLLSPDDVDGFVAAVRRFSGRPGLVGDRPEQEERGAERARKPSARIAVPPLEGRRAAKNKGGWLPWTRRRRHGWRVLYFGPWCLAPRPSLLTTTALSSLRCPPSCGDLFKPSSSSCGAGRRRADAGAGDGGMIVG